MSVVAVKKYRTKIVIGSDTQSTWGNYLKDPHKAIKCFKENDITFGVVGTSKELGLMRIFAKTHKIESADERAVLEYFHEFFEWCKNKDANFITECEYLIIIDSKIFNFTDFYVSEIEDYWAIGSGRDFALAALALGEDVEKALTTATMLDIYCSGPIEITEIPIEI